MIKFEHLINELTFGFGLGSTEPDYQDENITVSIHDSQQIRPSRKLQLSAHIGTVPNTTIPVIYAGVHKLGDRKEIVIEWNPGWKEYVLKNDSRYTLEPEDDAAMKMLIKLRSKSEKARV
jgi:hypothetical protein